jgi:RecB family endonuclease NucS
MNSIYAITTHHERKHEAANAWQECGVCAIGWESGENSQSRLFRNIQKGDLVLAFIGGSSIAFVGQIDGPYVETYKNIVGKKESDGGFGYPYQYKVNWYDEPCHFQKTDLPQWLADQIGKPHKTVVRLQLDRWSCDEVKNIILTTVKSGSSFGVNEDTVKAGIGKYLHRHIDALEKGLKIKVSEEYISETDRLDFRAEDKDAKTVIIECKGHALPTDCDQLKRYEKTMARKQKKAPGGIPRPIRLMLVAFNFEAGCRKEAAKNQIELFECDLTFRKHPPG